MKVLLMFLFLTGGLNSFASPGGHTLYGSKDDDYKVCLDWFGRIQGYGLVKVPARDEDIYDLESSASRTIFESLEAGVEFDDDTKEIIDYHEGRQIKLGLQSESRSGKCVRYMLKE